MRERTPSADDTPKRAPPAPQREAAPADVVGSKTSNDASKNSRVTKFFLTTSSTGTTTTSTTASASSLTSIDARMVASTHNLDDLGVNSNNDRQQQEEKHGYTYRTAQTAQDKRSRLSNVINNLRKKVPESRNGDTSRKKEEEERNNVERNLETLEKYVMTVLNGVIKDEEDNDVARKKEAEKESKKLDEDQEDEGLKSTTAKFEPSKPNESRTEVAILRSKPPDKLESNESSLERVRLNPRKENSVENVESDRLRQNEKQESRYDNGAKDKGVFEEEDTVDEGICKNGRVDEQTFKDNQTNRSLGTIIMCRLNESQSEEKENCRETVSDNAELRNICRDLLNDLLNGINQLIDENSQKKEEIFENSTDEDGESANQDVSMTSLHCSLPLDKVASVLQNCQTNESTSPPSPSSSSSTSQSLKSTSKPSSATVRHYLCLYCDRKFMSISLRQRHTERVHQQGRRPERNSRKSSQNCQYCSDKSAENLEDLFQHMVTNHAERYYGCVQCSTRYPNKEALTNHMSENHSGSVERNSQIQEKVNEPSSCKDLGNQSPRSETASQDGKSEDQDCENRTEPVLFRPIHSIKDSLGSPGSPEFDSSFYSSISCNIRENLLHHLDGKLQGSSSALTFASLSIVDAKPQQQQQQQQIFYEHNVSKIQLPIDISLTAATPVYSKEYSGKEYENNSEYAQKPGKSNRSHPRRVSFEKYNFPRKYDGREQWTCSIKDLSNFDISTQLSLRKKQEFLKERFSLNRMHQIPILGPTETTELVQDRRNIDSRDGNDTDGTDIVSTGRNSQEIDIMVRWEVSKMPENNLDSSRTRSDQGTEFSAEFGSFLSLRKWDEKAAADAAKKEEVVYAELTGEWSRPRVYVCGACASRHVTLKEMEDHKVSSHPNVWCSHFEFSGDQRELYKHLFLPGKDMPTAKARAAILVEKMCTKCSKNCNTLSELHRHMLECGGDQAWLLGLFGNGKKKCKWRPFGSRSRRRRQRGMKRNIQNSQTTRVNTPKEKQPTGPRVRPSDRESIQKMLANLPAKRATRKVLQDNSLRTQGRLRNVQTRRRARMVGDNSSASRMSRNKAVLRNKLLKNAKSIQRNRCRIDNISAVIESVVRNSVSEDEKIEETKKYENTRKIDCEEKCRETKVESSMRTDVVANERGNKKVLRGPRVLGKKRNVKARDGSVKNTDNTKKIGNQKTKGKAGSSNALEVKAESSNDALKCLKAPLKNVEKDTETGELDISSTEAKSPSLSAKNRNSLQTTPKRKRSVDPVASLNASIKAKSQLRTQDGKFARNPNKESPSPQKSNAEVRSSIASRVIVREKSGELSPDLTVTRPKQRTVSRNRNAEQLPKRTTRLSSDGDKMPTLEPVAQMHLSEEEFAEVASNDLPILSPVTSSCAEKVLRGKIVIAKSLDFKDGPKKADEIKRKNESLTGKIGNVQEGQKDQKQEKTRRLKSELKSGEKSVDNVLDNGNASKQCTKVLREKLKRKSAPSKLVNRNEKEFGDSNFKKETNQKKEEATLESGENSKEKLCKILGEDSSIKIETVPFEVKKLIGSDNKEDLLNKLVLSSRDTASKRCLRQPIAKTKLEQNETKVQSDPELVKSKLDSTVTSEVLPKKEKFDSRRKSLRKADKKDKTLSMDESVLMEEVGKNKEAVNEVKTVNKGQRNTRRGKLKANTEQSDKKMIETTEKDNDPVQDLETNEITNDLNTTGDKQKEIGNEPGKVSHTSEDNETVKINSNMHRIQVETNHSIDSGKENSLETAVPVQKSKVGRPRKSWGTRKDKTVKRSLNNVIGILTEGMNIPAETQQCVLNVQTNTNHPNFDEPVQNNLQQLDGGSSKLEKVDKPKKTPENNTSDVTDGSKKLIEETSEIQNTSETDFPKTESSEVANDQNMEDSLTKVCTDKPISKETISKSPTNDIILDLSRRKQKGKGSFLEKIVSKIAKQKDALLDGDVGSLLDTAADELSSILDEAAPNFSETIERNDRPKTEIDSPKENVVTVAPVESRILVDNLENMNAKSDEKESNINSNKEQSCDETINRNESLNEIEIKIDAISESLSDKIDDEQIENEPKKHPEIEEVQNDTSNALKIQKITTDSSEMNFLSKEKDTVATDPSKSDENNLKTEENEKDVKKDEDTRPKRKSKRRSVEGNSSKKNKKIFVESVDNFQENQISKELHLSLVINLIEKSKQVPSINENSENDFTVDVDVEKSENDKSLDNNLKVGQANDDDALSNVGTPLDSSKNIKKSEVDSDENFKDIEKVMKQGKIEISDSNTENYVQDVNEEKCSLSRVLIERRKSLQDETKKQHIEEETTYKTSDEIRESPTCLPKSEDIKGKIYSETKCIIRSNSDEKHLKETTGVCIPSIDILNFSANNVTRNDQSIIQEISEMRETSTASVEESKINETSESSNLEKRDENKKENDMQDPVANESKEPEIVVPKVPKKRGRKKKCVTNDEVKVTGPEAVKNLPPPRRSLRTSRSNEESEDQHKSSDETINNQQGVSSGSEQFKVPEVTEVFQISKKRPYKRRSNVDESLDNQSICPVPETSNMERSNVGKTVSKEDKKKEISCENDSSEKRKRSFRRFSKEQTDLQRSRSSGSIELPPTDRRKSLKRKQRSSEDLSASKTSNQRIESEENLLETSCSSESSYFRRRRSSKKKVLQESVEDLQTDTSVTDSESVDTEKSTERRQSLKRRAKKNISFLEDLLFLVDGFDIPMDIQDCISQEDSLENDVTNETDIKSSAIEDRMIEETSSIDTADQKYKNEGKEAVENMKQKSITEEEEDGDDDEEDEEEDSKSEDKIDEKMGDNLQQIQDDFQTPRKRTAGNYVVAHKRTGEIFIVEKKKKLTKEAARFFCDVCATSFTRKSSLKKHNHSQSHLIQLGKSKKDDTSFKENINLEEPFNAVRDNISDNKNATDEATNIPIALKCDQEEPNSEEMIEKQDFPQEKFDSCCTPPIEQSCLVTSEDNHRRTFEDELLDEEICKITENMSHDEYVLTDHLSPEPETTSAVVKPDINQAEEQETKTKRKRKKEKVKKNILDDEEISANDSTLEISTNFTLDSVSCENLAKENMAKSLALNVSEADSKNTDILTEESEISVPIAQKNQLEEKLVNDDKNLQENKDSAKVDCTEFDSVSNRDSLKANEKTECILENNTEHVNERTSLKLIINKGNVETNKTAEVENNCNYKKNYSNMEITDSENVCDDKYSLETGQRIVNDLEAKTNRFDSILSSCLPENENKGNSEIFENSVERNTFNVENIEPAESIKTLESFIDEQFKKTTSESEMKFDKQKSSTRNSRQGKSKRNKLIDRSEGVEINLSDRIGKKLTRCKTDQSKLIAEDDETSETMKTRQTIESLQKFSNNAIANSEIGDSKLDAYALEINCTTDSEKLEEQDNSKKSETVETENTLEESPQKFRIDPDSEEDLDSMNDKTNSLDSIDDYEISWSSSNGSKSISQILLQNEENFEQTNKREFTRNFVEELDEKRQSKKTRKIEDTNSGTRFEIQIENEPSTSHKLSDNQETKVEKGSKNELEIEKPSTFTSDKNTQILSESENTDTILPTTTTTSNENYLYNEQTNIANRKSVGNDHQNSNTKFSKTLKYSYKDSRRGSKDKKGSVRNKIVNVTSESDDSENEDETESQNKNKIVKCVFGRVFGGEKVDKVKEVLNDWVSKSEDDSEASRVDFGTCSPSVFRIKEYNQEQNSKKHGGSSTSPSNQKKRSGKQTKKCSHSSKSKETNSISENQGEHRSEKHIKARNNSNSGKREPEVSNGYFEALPSTKYRPSKKRAEELISRTFENDIFETIVDKCQKLSKCNKEINYGLRNHQIKDQTKNGSRGSIDYDEESSKLPSMENAIEEIDKVPPKRKSSTSRKSKNKINDDIKDWNVLLDEKISLRNRNESSDQENSIVKEDSFKGLLSKESDRLSVDLESLESSKSLTSVRTRYKSPSVDGNSKTTKDSDVDEEEEDEDMKNRRISPEFAGGTPRSIVESDSNSENDEDDESMVVKKSLSRKRSSGEYPGEKIAIRSPSSTNKSEIVVISPTDAIEDNALDVPQEIEAAKLRQGKVLNFDEELFVECCSRLKATTENELRGAKKIKLDHNESYHRKDEQQSGFRGPRDRWRDVESQNSLGSLLESVNQLLGEEMYSTKERDHSKRGGRNLGSEHSSRSASPDTSRADNLGYEDSLDVAFEHNNKLRDKIQQRMRESENLIAHSFGQRSNNDIMGGKHRSKDNGQQILRNSYPYEHNEKYLPASNMLNGGYSDTLHVRSVQLQQSSDEKINLDSTGLGNKINPSLGGLLDKALDNLLHNNEKHDHIGPTPMKVLAELACARAPTSTAEDTTSHQTMPPLKFSSPNKNFLSDSTPPNVTKDLQKKIRNPIKELFERKKEMNERNQQEKAKTETSVREANTHKQRKTKKNKKRQDFPLIRQSEFGGLTERKKRRDGIERKDGFNVQKIKDIYDFDEEESQIEPSLTSVMSFRSKSGCGVACLKTKEVEATGIKSLPIGDSTENDKTGDAVSTKLENMIDRKFTELEKFAPKTKGALKSFQSEDQQPRITGPMDEFVERKHTTAKKSTETVKYSKLKKRSKNSKKKNRNSWYEDDSSDEYRTAAKTEDVGVGISKSQRTCSKGKQNIFAELYTSSESEMEGLDYESRRQRRVKKSTKKNTRVETADESQKLIDKYLTENEDQTNDWCTQDLRTDVVKHDSDHKKSESEMSDHPLVIDERKDVEEQKNSDDETENQYERNFEMDDLYREDSSVVDSDIEGTGNLEQLNVSTDSREKSSHLSQEKTDDKTDYIEENELIPLEEALDLLDQADRDASLDTKYEKRNDTTFEIHTVNSVEPVKEVFSPAEDLLTKSLFSVDEQDEEPDNDLLSLPEKLSGNEKPQKESDNLPLHVFLSRKVQESKKRKEQQLKKMQEEQERFLMDYQPTRRQRKCAIGKQGLLAEISSSDEEYNFTDRRFNDKLDYDKPKKQKRESKEKRKERYIEKKHEQMIAKEQKAIEEEILREVGKKKESLTDSVSKLNTDIDDMRDSTENTENANGKTAQEPTQKKKHQTKEKQKKQNTFEEDLFVNNDREEPTDMETDCNATFILKNSENKEDSVTEQKKHNKFATKSKKSAKTDAKVTNTNKKNKNLKSDKKNKTDSKGSKDKERKASSNKKDSDDEELKTTKSWNKVEEGVGVAIGRRKRAAANQLYYWSSSSDEEELLEIVPTVEEEEDDRQEQHGWIVGDSHKRMITMLAMEKQLKEKRRRSEDEFEPGKGKNKKHRNSTS